MVKTTRTIKTTTIGLVSKKTKKNGARVACVQTSPLPQFLREGGRLYTGYARAAPFL